MAKLFLGLGNQMTARFNDIDNMIRLNTEKVTELEKSQEVLKEEIKRMQAKKWRCIFNLILTIYK